MRDRPELETEVDLVAEVIRDFFDGDPDGFALPRHEAVELGARIVRRLRNQKENSLSPQTGGE